MSPVSLTSSSLPLANSGSRDALFASALDEALRTKDFEMAIAISSHLGSDEMVRKIADSIEKGSLNETELQEIETAILEKPYYANPEQPVLPRAKTTLLNALLFVYRTLNNKGKVKELERKLAGLEYFSTYREGKMILAFLWRMFVFQNSIDPSSTGFFRCFTSPLSLTLLGRDLVAHKYTALQKTENRLGVDAAVVASGFFGLSFLPAVGVGAGTALAARIPLVQKVFKQTVEVTLEKSLKAAHSLFDGTVYALKSVKILS